MLKSKYANPLENFVVHGVKQISGFNYVLLIDEGGQAVIKQVALDNSTILFAELSTPVNPQQSLQAQAITNFWATPTNYTYVYMFQLQ